MNTRILILTALVATLGAEGALAAKSKCEFREETNDFFSGVPTLRTAWTPVNPDECEGDCNARGSLSIVKEPGNQWVEFDAWFTVSHVFVPTQAELDNAFVVTSAVKLEVTLADGTVVELPIVAPVDSTNSITYPYENNNDNYLVRSSALMHFELSQNTLAALGGQESSMISLVGEYGALMMPVPKKKQTFMEAANCLQKAGGK